MVADNSKTSTAQRASLPGGWSSYARQGLQLLEELKPAKGIGRRILFTAVPIIVGAGVLGAHHFWYSEDARINRVVAAFESGGSHLKKWLPADSKDGMVPRDALQSSLAHFLTSGDSYKVIIGENGVGKTTAVRRTLRNNRDEPGSMFEALRKALFSKRDEAGGLHGALYYLCEDFDDFANTFADNCGYSGFTVSIGEIGRVWSGFTSPRSNEASSMNLRFWNDKLAPVLKQAAVVYKERHGKAPIVVIDAADKIAKGDPGFMLKLQDLAKIGADGGPLQICFVASDGTALPLLTSNSNQSRMGLIFEIGEISDDDAVQYLISSKKLPEVVAKELVATITGGRFALLNKLAEYVDAGHTVEEIRDEYYTATDTTLKLLKVKPSSDLFKTLLNDKRCKTNAALDFADMNEDILGKLVKENIIAIHPDKTYTFQSRHVETFFAHKLSSPSPAS